MVQYGRECLEMKEFLMNQNELVEFQEGLSYLNENEKVHPWRRCEKGKHFVKEYQKKYPEGVETIHNHCALNPSHKEELSYDEIQYITQKYFKELPGPPAAGRLKFKDADTYDSLIRGWVFYWNDIFKLPDPLDANYIKALIATESGFRKDPPENPHAHGLMQLLHQSWAALQDIKGELKDHLIRVPWNKILEPTANICMGIRWLLQKRYLLSVRLKREVTWEEAVIEYKSYWGDIDKYKEMPKGIKDLREYYKQLVGE